MLSQVLHLADNALILGHRNSEWTGHGPILEQDIALSNIALDLIGQARNFYQYAAELSGNNATEDLLAYTRSANEFHNFLLVEQENGDWAKTILRQFFFSAYQYPLFQQMQGVGRLQSIAEKSLKEVTYHLRWSSEWVIRLGQGTEESHKRMVTAINDLWKYTGELVLPEIKDAWQLRVKEILSIAGVAIPLHVNMMSGGMEGRHTEHLKKLLEEMQYMQRTYPGVEW
jgi:ring-1,2-phenylacetyl-CoA epoxidase subunit PaaC